MKVLVIGAAGMIGRKLVERLARDGALAAARDRSLAGGRHRRAVAAAGAVPDHDAKLATSPRSTCRASSRRGGRTSCSCSPRSSPARRRPISTKATASTSTARA